MFKDVMFKCPNESFALGIIAASFFAVKSKKDIAESPTLKGNAQIIYI